MNNQERLLLAAQYGLAALQAMGFQTEAAFADEAIRREIQRQRQATKDSCRGMN